MGERSDDSVKEPGQKISLVLGSGGARGHAHIGVIRALEERGLVIRNLAGTSMGAVIGGIHATGDLQTYEDWAYRLDKRNVLKLLDLSFVGGSVFKGERIFEVLRELIGEQRIEALKLGFTAVATDLDTQREIWLNEGPLFRAMRASSAVPGVFAPVEFEGRTLVDGGLVNPIPIAPTLNDETDLTVAVNLNAVQTHPVQVRRQRRQRRQRQDTENEREYRNRLTEFFGELFKGQDEGRNGRGAAATLVRSIDVMQGAIARLKLAAYQPDVVIDIPRDAASFFEFHRAEELAELGYQQTRQALDDLDL